MSSAQSCNADHRVLEFHLSAEQSQTLKADLEIDAMLEATMVAGFNKVIDESMDDEIGVERKAAAGGALFCPEIRSQQPPRDPEKEQYCSYVLRNEQCPSGHCCRFKHLGNSPCGSPSCGDSNDGMAIDDALTCVICQEPFVDPVTLPCGHSFDWSCLDKFCTTSLVRALGGAGAACPVCRHPITLPLPAVNIALRELVKARCPHKVDAREAELRLRKRIAPTTAEHAEATGGMPVVVSKGPMQMARIGLLVFVVLVQLSFVFSVVTRGRAD